MSAALLSREDGMALAIQMLGELESEAERNEACALEAEYRAPGAPQRNIVLEYLDAIERAHQTDARAGFASVITDYLACCAGGSVPNSAFYDQFVEEGARGAAR